ncbi:hypothetical protein PTT_08575 [Pyrenophora teres f. teres 0-1]|uniref:Uncharacterized protein n=2 Tax=Pyrenophora teres f. teres TaxID=97479 RepID=E3RK43_PYRTT|nr:hypothetical protein PTT_08575 [Pyrenophora teres f. teres 0-1]CAE7030536.1 hypothetical protein PTTW11_04576 [Pyrenophora teres f. teres]
MQSFPQEMMPFQRQQQQQQPAPRLVATAHWEPYPTQVYQPSVPQAAGRLRFTSRAHAHQVKASKPLDSDWLSPQTDSTFPTHSAAHGHYLCLLTTAFLCTRTCLDKRTDTPFITHWAPNPDKPSPITPSKVELTCRRLLSIAIALHTYGPSSLCIYDAGRMQNANKTNKMTFLERIGKVCELLRLSKARCVTLIKGEGLHMCVAAPGILVRRTHMNRTQNERRQKALVRGRKRTVGEMKGDEE